MCINGTFSGGCQISYNISYTCRQFKKFNYTISRPSPVGCHIICDIVCINCNFTGLRQLNLVAAAG